MGFRMKRLTLILALAGSILWGQNKVGTTAAQFLKVGIGGRATGMGEAFVAVANDASALYWNPAGIARLSGPEVMLLNTRWLADITFNYAGVTFPLYGLGTAGAAITSVSIPDQPVRTEEKQEGTGEYYSAGDLAIQFSFARNLTDRFSIGFNAKYIQEKIWHMQAQGMALDVGTLFITHFHDMRLGMSISNYGSTMQMRGRDALVRYDPDPQAAGNNDQIPAELKTDSWSLPLVFRVGVALDAWKSKISRLTVAADALHPNDNLESINLGAEFAVLDLFSLRIGWKSPYLETNPGAAESSREPREDGLTYGLGLKLPLFGTGADLTFDYAYADFGRLKQAQRFSLQFTF